MVFLSIPSKLPSIFFFIESTAAKTAIIEKIPIVTPSSERNVRNLLFLNAFNANVKLSPNNLKYKNIPSLLLFIKLVVKKQKLLQFVQLFLKVKNSIVTFAASKQQHNDTYQENQSSSHFCI